MRRFPLSALIGLTALAGCVSAPQPAPRPAPPRPVPRPTPAPLPAPKPAEDWRDWPFTPGDWVYRQDARGSIALFGRTGFDADFVIRCDRQRGRVFLSRAAPAGMAAGTLAIQTSSAMRLAPARTAGATPNYLAVELDVRDPVLDAMGFSRGRFTVAMQGLPTLVLPAWAEVLRVTEDCR